MNELALSTDILLTDTNRWSAPVRLAIGLSKVGCRVSALCPPRHPLLKTSVVKQSFHYSGVRPLDSLVAAIEASKPRIIIPCDDRGVHHLHELYACARRFGAAGTSIEDLVERSLGRHESYPVVSARYDLLRIAREEGLRVPDASPIKTPGDLRTWCATQEFPCVLKADGTFGGRGVRIAQNLEEAARYLSEIGGAVSTKRAIKRLIVNDDSFWLRPWWEGLKPAVMVQAYIQGRAANCAVVCWEGKVLAGIAVEVLSAEGATGPANVVRVVDNPEMMYSAERIAHRMKLSGFFGLDFMLEEGSGAAYLIEMNPRCTPLCHLRLKNGGDMIGALWSQLSGQPAPETPPLTQNDTIAYFPQAWLNKSEWLQSSFHDVPYEEPDLIRELLGISLPRPFLSRVGSALLQKSG